MASIASSTLLPRANLPTLFNHRYQALSWKSQELPSFSLQRREEEVDSYQPDEDGGAPFAKPVKTIRFVKSTADEAAGRVDEIGQYLWEVYQRVPTKRDGSGDFTWKDPASAERVGLSMPEYVIGGMDLDFREQLYHAGRAMDAAGIKWAILSAFRDDYRQGLASGYKARARNSLHGGSARTGGYGHGRAVDVTNGDGDAEAVWKWIDTHGAAFGLYRPMPGIDPGHVQSRGEWRMLATALRRVRTKSVQANGPTNTPATRGNLVASTSR